MAQQQSSSSSAAAAAAAAAPAVAQSAVLVQSEPMPADTLVVRGYDFNEGVDYHRLLRSFMTTGYQATSFAQAVHEVERMVRNYSSFKLRLFYFVLFCHVVCCVVFALIRCLCQSVSLLLASLLIVCRLLCCLFAALWFLSHCCCMLQLSSHDL